MRVIGAVIVLLLSALPARADKMFTNEDLMQYKAKGPIIDAESTERIQSERGRGNRSVEQWLKDSEKDNEIESLKQKLEEEKQERRKLEQELKVEKQRREKAEESRLIILPDVKFPPDKKR